MPLVSTGNPSLAFAGGMSPDMGLPNLPVLLALLSTLLAVAGGLGRSGDRDLARARLGELRLGALGVYTAAVSLSLAVRGGFFKLREPLTAERPPQSRVRVGVRIKVRDGVRSHLPWHVRAFFQSEVSQETSD